MRQRWQRGVRCRKTCRWTQQTLRLRASSEQHTGNLTEVLHRLHRLQTAHGSQPHRHFASSPISPSELGGPVEFANVPAWISRATKRVLCCRQSCWWYLKLLWEYLSNTCNYSHTLIMREWKLWTTDCRGTSGQQRRDLRRHDFSSLCWISDLFSDEKSLLLEPFVCFQHVRFNPDIKILDLLKFKLIFIFIIK